MKQKILHIIQDQKFPDSAYELFESVAPGLSKYILPDKNNPLIYLTKVNPERVSKFSFLNPFFLKSLEKYDVVILHALTDFNCELVARCSTKVNFLWVGLGYDYYDLLYKSRLEMLQPITRRIVSQHIPEFADLKPKKVIKQFLRAKLYKNTKDKSRVIQKIRWFAPVLDNEYQLLKKSFKNLNSFPEYIDWNYAITANLIEQNHIKLTDGEKNILVGNSASPYNNHHEIFEYLQSLDLPEKTKIIVPLSYGSSKYRDIIIECGNKLLGRKFLPITDFIPFDKYMKLLATCPTVIMNHNRQQAGGNIAAALYMGARVFVNADNHFYGHYKKHNAVINEIEQLRIGEVFIDSPLTREEIDLNRRIIETLRSRAVAIDKTQKFIKKVQDDRK
jgi:hypothetical protein